MSFCYEMYEMDGCLISLFLFLYFSYSLQHYKHLDLFVVRFLNKWPLLCVGEGRYYIFNEVRLCLDCWTDTGIEKRSRYPWKYRQVCLLQVKNNIDLWHKSPSAFDLFSLLPNDPFQIVTSFQLWKLCCFSLTSAFEKSVFVVRTFAMLDLFSFWTIHVK